MADGWIETTLGQVADYENGYPFKPSELTGRGLPVVRIKQLLDPLAEADLSDVEVGARHHIDDGDLIFSWSGTLASRTWTRGPALLNQHLFRVIERPGVERGWLQLALEHAVDALMEKSHGTTMKHVTKKVLESHPVRVPPPLVQRRIVDLVGTLDAHITALDDERVAAWALLTALREDLLAGGDLVSLAEVCSIEGRLVDPRDERYSHLIHVGVEAIEKNTGRLRKPRTAAQDQLISAKYLYADQDVIYAKIRPILRKVALPGGTGLCSADAYPLRPVVGLPPSLLREALLLDAVVEAVVASSGRTKMPKVNRKELFAVKVPLGDAGTWQAVAAPLAAARSVAETLEDELSSLHAVRAVILREVLSGARTLMDAYDSVLAKAG